jgi:hypothetical protein
MTFVEYLSDESYYAKCHHNDISSVIMLGVIKLDVIMLKVIISSIITLVVIMLG